MLLKRLIRWKVNNPGKIPVSIKRLGMLYLQCTSWLRCLPDFIIIGGQKCGTTSLYNYLALHPNVMPSFRKEVRYFDRNHARSIRWYRAHFPTRFWRERESRRTGRAVLTGEASPNYMEDPEAPARVRRVLPDVKLIAMLRDPVERAISHYFHDVAAGRDVPSLERAIDEELPMLSMRDGPARHAEGAGRPVRGYLLQGLYARHLEKWLSLFPRSQVLVLKGEDLFEEPAATFAATLEFLGLPPWEPGEWRRFKKGRRDAVPEHVREKLRAVFSPYNERLCALPGIDFRWD